MVVLLETVVALKALDLIASIPTHFQSPELDSLLFDVRGRLLLCDVGAHPGTVTVGHSGSLELANERKVGLH